MRVPAILIMKVFVKNMRGQALMPCSPRKARILLKQKKAKIISYQPFAIQLCYSTGEAKQEIVIGIDEGAKHVGIAVVSKDRVLAKGEIKLRQDVHSLLLARAQYRRGRRYRKTRIRTFQKYPEAEITYGSETSERRKALVLEKTHYNDAIAITGIKTIKENPSQCFFVTQFRKKKRSLYEATPRKGRKTKNTGAVRSRKNTKESKGWFLNDEVFCYGKRGWISGFTGSAAYVINCNGDYIIRPGKNHKQVSLSNLSFLKHNNNWQYIVA